MAKFTITGKSTQATTYTNTGLGNRLLGLYDRGGRVKAKPFTYTNTSGAALADGSYVELCSVGPCRILPNSFVSTSAMGTARVLNLGFQEYKDREKATVSGDANALLADYDVAAATYYKVIATDTASLAGQAGLDITGPTQILAQVTGGTLPTNGTIKGVIFVIED